MLPAFVCLHLKLQVRSDPKPCTLLHVPNYSQITYTKTFLLSFQRNCQLFKLNDFIYHHSVWCRNRFYVKTCVFICQGNSFTSIMYWRIFINFLHSDVYFSLQNILCDRKEFPTSKASFSLQFFFSNYATTLRISGGGCTSDLCGSPSLL